MTKSQVTKNIFNFVFVLLTAYTAVLLYTRWIKKDARQNQNAPAFTALNLQNESVKLPMFDGKPSVIVFWATWCGPCKLELDRMKQAADKGEIPMDRIFAVSIGEDLATVRAEARARDYKFQVFADELSAGASAFRVRVTPTTLIVGTDGLIEWVSEGLHPLSVRRARGLFKATN